MRHRPVAQPARSQPAPVAGVEEIAVLRANGIGDLVFALPALEALRRAYPHARITLLGAAAHRALLEGRTGPVDEVLVVPRCPGVAEQPGAPEGGLEEFLTMCRQRRFDLALQLHGGGRFSNRFVRALGAGLTAGLRAPDAPALDRWVRYVYLQPEVLRYLEVVRLVGAGGDDLEPHLAVGQEDRRAALEALGPAPGRPLVVLNPAAGDVRRRWPPERFAAVADALAARRAAVVVLGGPNDAPVVDAVLARTSAPARRLVGVLDLPGVLGLLAEADLVVSNDTGPLHLAMAVGTPTVGVYWLFNVVNAGPVHRHRHRVVAALDARCPVCGVENLHVRCPHDVSFVGSATVAEVLAEAEDLLRLARGEDVEDLALRAGDLPGVEA